MGNGFEELIFEIALEGSAVFQETFSGATGVDEAEAFFDDNTLDLGAVSELIFTGDLAVSFRLDLTVASEGDGFMFAGIFGNSTIGSGPDIPVTPEPAGWLLLVVAFGVLLRLRRATSAI